MVHTTEALERKPEETSVLVVDDDALFCSRLSRGFSRRGYLVSSATSASDARALFGERSFDWAVIDLRLPETTGLFLLQEMIERSGTAGSNLKAVILTGYGSIATALEAVRIGAVNYLTKPTELERIIEVLTHPQESNQSPKLDSPVPSLESVEWEHINRVLADCEGNVSRAAKILGVHRRSLQRRLAKIRSA